MVIIKSMQTFSFFVTALNSLQTVHPLVACIWKNYPYHPRFQKATGFLTSLLRSISCSHLSRQIEWDSDMTQRVSSERVGDRKKTKRRNDFSFQAEKWLYKINFTTINWKINSRLPLQIPVWTLSSLKSLFLSGRSLSTRILKPRR